MKKILTAIWNFIKKVLVFLAKPWQWIKKAWKYFLTLAGQPWFVLLYPAVVLTLIFLVTKSFFVFLFLAIWGVVMIVNTNEPD
jgi:hypothetical protein